MMQYIVEAKTTEELIYFRSNYGKEYSPSEQLKYIIIESVLLRYFIN